MIVLAHGKLNLSLRVRSREASGFHPLRSLVQSIGWSDRIGLDVADEGAFEITGDLPVEEDVPSSGEPGTRRAPVDGVAVRLSVHRASVRGCAALDPDTAPLDGGEAGRELAADQRYVDVSARESERLRGNG